MTSRPRSTATWCARFANAPAGASQRGRKPRNQVASRQVTATSSAGARWRRVASSRQADSTSSCRPARRTTSTWRSTTTGDAGSVVGGQQLARERVRVRPRGRLVRRRAVPSARRPGLPLDGDTCTTKADAARVPVPAPRRHRRTRLDRTDRGRLAVTRVAICADRSTQLALAGDCPMAGDGTERWCTTRSFGRAPRGRRPCRFRLGRRTEGGDRRSRSSRR